MPPFRRRRDRHRERSAAIPGHSPTIPGSPRRCAPRDDDSVETRRALRAVCPQQNQDAISAMATTAKIENVYLPAALRANPMVTNPPVVRFCRLFRDDR